MQKKKDRKKIRNGKHKFVRNFMGAPCGKGSSCFKIYTSCRKLENAKHYPPKLTDPPCPLRM